MQKEGTVRFLREHTAQVKGVAFSPTDRYLFTSGSNDGKINVYNANHSSFHSLVVSYQLNATFGV
jgi:WD40 repeat protein